jgi:transcriptional regulator with XRE-family HTH domain
MYYILENELKKKKMTRDDFAKALGIGITTVSCKLNMKSDFSLSECLKAKQLLNYGGSIDELFKHDTT